MKLVQNRTFFGKEILDIGCNNGIITCFIAKLCPDAHITGIDIEASSIRIAEELAASLDLNNIDFKKADFKELTDSYNTIFVSKVSHELVDIERVVWDNDYKLMVERFQKMFSGYASQIRQLLKDIGTLITVDRIPYNVARCGLYQALNEMNVVPDMSTFSNMQFQSMGEFEKIPFVCCKIGAPNPDEIMKVFIPIFKEEERKFYRQ